MNSTYRQDNGYVCYSKQQNKLESRFISSFLPSFFPSICNLPSALFVCSAMINAPHLTHSSLFYFLLSQEEEHRNEK